MVYGAVERHDFYRRVQDSFVVVQTTEDQPYACFMLQKGVV
ncbi:RbsD/FucU domain-containing protein [Arthrobacter sp. GAS37]